MPLDTSKPCASIIKLKYKICKLDVIIKRLPIKLSIFPIMISTTENLFSLNRCLYECLSNQLLISLRSILSPNQAQKLSIKTNLVTIN